MKSFIFKLTFTMSQELDDFAHKRVLEQNDVFGHVFEESQKAPFRVEPRIGAQFLLIRLQAFHHSRYSEFVFSFGTVQCPFFGRF